MRLAFAFCLCAGPALADTLIATRTLPAHTLVALSDLAVSPSDVPGALRTPEEAAGQETRVTIYAGRPIRAGDLGRPALIERNQLVSLSFRSGGLHITAEGRALGRAAAGERLQVMNLASRTMLTGVVAPDGSVDVNR